MAQHDNPLDTLFASSYAARPEDAKVFGDGYKAPEKFKHGERTLIYSLPYDKENGGDGYAVDIYETRMPARFFEVVAHAGFNSINEPHAGFSISTGSGGNDLAVWVLDLANQINRGMLAVRTTVED